MESNLTQFDYDIIQKAQDLKNPSVFTNYYMRPKAGGYPIYPGTLLHKERLATWIALGKPDVFRASFGEVPFKVYPVDENLKPIQNAASIYDMGNGYGRKIVSPIFFEERGFILLPWALDLHRSQQDMKVVIGTPGVGKTYQIAAESQYLCATTPNFHFLNVAPLLYQSNLMVRAVEEITRDTIFRDRFILPGKAGWVNKPYVKITFYNGSTWEAMNVANNADNVQSWGGDAINCDEFGILNELDETGTEQAANIMIGLITRLRGIRADGRPRMGRMSLISMAYDCDTLWDRYEAGLTKEGSKNIWSRTVLFDENPFLSEKDRERFQNEARKLGAEDQWIKGKRPQKKGAYFTNAIIQPMLVKGMLEEAKVHAENQDLGWVYDIAGPGIIGYEQPYISGHTYVMAGDPGVGDAPDRNAPVIVLFDVTEFPEKPAVMAGFWWGSGNGYYTPFIDKFKELALKFRVDPNFKAYDSTSTQKALAELAFISGEDAVVPLGFEGSMKWQYLNALRLILSHQLMRIPEGIDGLERQLRRYQLPDKKIPQDTVSALAMVSFLLYPLYLSAYPEYEDVDKNKEMDWKMVAAYGRENRSAGRESLGSR